MTQSEAAINVCHDGEEHSTVIHPAKNMVYQEYNRWLRMVFSWDTPELSESYLKGTWNTSTALHPLPPPPPTVPRKSASTSIMISNLSCWCPLQVLVPYNFPHYFLHLPNKHGQFLVNVQAALMHIERFDRLIVDCSRDCFLQIVINIRWIVLLSSSVTALSASTVQPWTTRYLRVKPRLTGSYTHIQPDLWSWVPM